MKSGCDGKTKKKERKQCGKSGRRRVWNISVRNFYEKGITKGGKRVGSAWVTV